jgi:hypothetical protein
MGNIDEKESIDLLTQEKQSTTLLLSPYEVKVLVPQR